MTKPEGIVATRNECALANHDACAQDSGWLPGRAAGGPAGSALSCCFRRGALAFFVYGFAKSDRENLRPDELAAFRLLADEYLALDAAGLAAAQSVGAIAEVKSNGKTVQE